ncbi:MAG: HAMP domain-containing histidine kinase [Clostridia bacterium]|nr:HAMP domain-containing histidine kinase [Clostridia bacterium]
MEFIIIILIVIIIILLTYLFLYHNELKNISKEIDYIKNMDSNTLIHSKYNLKNINNLIQKINNLVTESKDIKTDYSNKNKALMKMMTNISHDLRTPLTSALGYIDIILKSDMSEEEKKKDLITIEKRLKRLEELISSFFEFSKIITTNKTPELEKVNLNSVLEESIIFFYNDYKKSNREILLECEQRKIIINSNRMLLTRIFENLIGNAYKHSNSDLNIKVEIKDRIKIVFGNELLNNDIDIDRIFDEFYTVDISRTKQGTGLGLAIAKEFTKQLGGNIYAEKNEEILKIIIEI